MSLVLKCLKLDFYFNQNQKDQSGFNMNLSRTVTSPPKKSRPNSGPMFVDVSGFIRPTVNPAHRWEFLFLAKM